MSRHQSVRRIRRVTAFLSCVLLASAFQLVMPVARASSASPIHIELIVEDPTSGGPVTQNDTLIITAKAYKDGVRVRSGEIVVSTVSPAKKYLCEIGTFPYSRDNCKTRLSEAGLWQVVARLSTTKAPPWHYVASVLLSMNVMPVGIGDN